MLDVILLSVIVLRASILFLCWYYIIYVIILEKLKSKKKVSGRFEISITGIFFKLSFIKEVTTEKVSQFTMPLKSIYNKNVCVQKLKCIF
jgi:hypothetical protein